jgi:hypothetical protein
MTTESNNAIRFAFKKSYLLRQLHKALTRWEEPTEETTEETVAEAVNLLRQARQLGMTNIPQLVCELKSPTLFIGHYQWTKEFNLRLDQSFRQVNHWFPLFDFLDSGYTDQQKQRKILRTILEYTGSSEYGSEICIKILDNKRTPAALVANLCIEYLSATSSASTLLYRIFSIEKRAGMVRLPFLSDLAVHTETSLNRLVKLAQETFETPSYTHRIIESLLYGCKYADEDQRKRCTLALMTILETCIPQIVQGGEGENATYPNWPSWIYQLAEIEGDTLQVISKRAIHLHSSFAEGSASTLPGTNITLIRCKEAVFRLLCALSSDKDVLDLVFPVLNSGKFPFTDYKDPNYLSREIKPENQSPIVQRMHSVNALLDGAICTPDGATQLLKLLESNKVGVVVQAMAKMSSVGLGPTRYITEDIAIATILANGLYDLAESLDGFWTGAPIRKMALRFSGRYGCLNERLKREMLSKPIIVRTLINLCSDHMDPDLMGFVPILLDIVVSTSPKISSQERKEAFACVSRNITYHTDQSQLDPFWRLDDDLLSEHILRLNCKSTKGCEYAFKVLASSAEDQALRKDRRLMFACLIHVLRGYLENSSDASDLGTIISVDEILEILAEADSLGGDSWQDCALKIANRAGDLFSFEAPTT